MIIHVSGVRVVVITAKRCAELGFFHYSTHLGGRYVRVTGLDFNELTKIAGLEGVTFDTAIPDSAARALPDYGAGWVWVYPPGSLFGKPMDMRGAVNKAIDQAIDQAIDRLVDAGTEGM